MGVKTEADYLAQLAGLLPPGIAWNRDPASVLMTLLAVFADTLAGVDASANALLSEMDWRTTFLCLPDWERVAGLPDPAIGGAYQTIPERRAWLLLRMTMLGGQSRAFFIGLAGLLGYTITITEYHASVCGVAVCGDPLGGAELNSTWQIKMPSTPTWQAVCGDAVCGDLLGSWQTGVVEALFQRLKPAHSVLYFTYGS